MKKILIVSIKIYQITISKILVSIFGGGCRFTPSCSRYAEKAIEKYGVCRGVRLSVSRITRCHPFSKSYGYDPVE